jgi:hypothetical protein
MYASHTDAHIYSFYSYKWSLSYEEFLRTNCIDNSVIAYRKILKEDDSARSGKSNIEFAESVFRSIKELGECDVIVADISKFFDSLNHRILKEQLCRILGTERLEDDEYKVLRSLTAYRYVLRGSQNKSKQSSSPYSRLAANAVKIAAKKKCSISQAVYEAGRDVIKYNRSSIGIPQGSPVSGLLANIYLASLDTEIHIRFPEIVYRRYSDDIVLICEPGNADLVLTELTKMLTDSRLKVSPSKVFVAIFRNNLNGSLECQEVKDGKGVVHGRRYLDYLGFEFNGEKVLVRGNTVKKAYNRAKQRIAKFYERQAATYSHLKPRKKSTGLSRSNRSNYIERAATAMKSVGSNIDSQQKKIAKGLRNQRSSDRKPLDDVNHKAPDS